MGRNLKLQAPGSVVTSPDHRSIGIPHVTKPTSPYDLVLRCNLERIRVYLHEIHRCSLFTGHIQQIMESPLDQTTLSTISLLESRLLRIEHLLYGSSSTTHPTQHGSALQHMAYLEKRFSTLTSKIRVYGELLKICLSIPSSNRLAL